jgi:hypothetical protein
MQELMNESIITLINDGLLSVKRINSLIFIKSFIDRISTGTYIDEETAARLGEKFGARPTIVTWGDYFQSEMATSLLVVSDAEFEKAVQTLKFDMVASWIIFSEKDDEFFDWVDATHAKIIDSGKNDYTEEENEILHLKILKDYYKNLGLVNAFTEAELCWFVGFREADAG